MDTGLGSGEGRAHMKRLLPALTLLLISLTFIVGSAAGQQCEEGADSCEGGGAPPASALCSNSFPCETLSSYDIAVLYRYGQPVYINCGTSGTPKCPDVKDVDIKVKVLPSVARVLHTSSTTISVAETHGPLTGKQVDVPDPNDNFDPQLQYYFVQLKPAVERRMKKIKVRMISMTVSGSVTRADGTKVAVKSDELVSVAFPGNCSGQSLRIKRRLTYGGHCMAF
jgi:hypothetical protein